MEIVASAGYLGVSGVYSKETERLYANKKSGAEAPQRSLKNE
jgi:hypothetical protein